MSTQKSIKYICRKRSEYTCPDICSHCPEEQDCMGTQIFVTEIFFKPAGFYRPDFYERRKGEKTNGKD